MISWSNALHAARGEAYLLIPAPAAGDLDRKRSPAQRMPDPALSPRFLAFPRSLRNHYGDALLLGEGLALGLELLGEGDGVGDDVVPGST